MLKGIGPCNKDPSICNVVSLFNFPQKAGSLPEKLVLEILLLPFFIVKQYRRTLQSELKEEKDT